MVYRTLCRELKVLCLFNRCLVLFFFVKSYCSTSTATSNIRLSIEPYFLSPVAFERFPKRKGWMKRQSIKRENRVVCVFNIVSRVLTLFEIQMVKRYCVSQRAEGKIDWPANS